MDINQHYFAAIKPLLEKLREKVEGDFVLFGSSTLYLLGIEKFKDLNDIHDLDVTLDGTIKEGVAARTVYFENDPDKKLCKVNIDGIAIDIGTRWPGQETWFERIFTDPIVVGGFKFANLQTVLDYKKANVAEYNREKDKRAVARIENYLGLPGV